MIRQGFAVVGAAAVLAIGGVVTPLRPSAQAASMTMGSISLLAPATGSVITSNTIDVQIAVKGFTPVESIAAVSEENSASAEQVSAATEELSAQATEVVTSATSLAAMAARLDELLGAFHFAEAAAADHGHPAPIVDIRRSRAA